MWYEVEVIWFYFKSWKKNRLTNLAVSFQTHIKSITKSVFITSKTLPDYAPLYLRLCGGDAHSCIQYLQTGLLWWSPVQGVRQSPGQAPIHTELSSQGPGTHQAQAAHHPHWLSVRFHITYKSPHALTPWDLFDLLRHHTPPWILRSSHACLLSQLLPLCCHACISCCLFLHWFFPSAIQPILYLNLLFYLYFIYFAFTTFFRCITAMCAFNCTAGTNKVCWMDFPVPGDGPSRQSFQTRLSDYLKTIYF